GSSGAWHLRLPALPFCAYISLSLSLHLSFWLDGIFFVLLLFSLSLSFFFLFFLSFFFSLSGSFKAVLCMTVFYGLCLASAQRKHYFICTRSFSRSFSLSPSLSLFLSLCSPLAQKSLPFS